MKEVLERIAVALESIGDALAKSDNPVAEESAQTIDKDSLTLEQAGFSNRTIHAMYAIGVRTVGQLRAMSEVDIKRVRNIGALCVKEIRSKLDGNCGT